MALLPQITLSLSSLTPSLLHTHTKHVTVVKALCLKLFSVSVMCLSDVVLLF